VNCTAVLHGTLNAYNHYGCRCDEARAVALRREKERQLRLIREGRDSLLEDPTGTARRLQALAVLGWGSRQLAAALGTTQCQILRWQAAKHRVHADSAALVAEAYERLQDEPPTGERASRTQHAAARARWVGPEAWDDDTIDDPDASPRKPAPRPRVYVEDVEWLVDSGLSWAGLVDRFGVERETIQRALCRHDRRDLLERLSLRESA
jgi:hypothetical protein